MNNIKKLNIDFTKRKYLTLKIDNYFKYNKLKTTLAKIFF